MQKIVNIQEAKTQLSKLLSEVEESRSEVIIARYNKPIAKLVAIEHVPKDRTPGSAKGEFVLPASFFEPLPADVLAAFEE